MAAMPDARRIFLAATEKPTNEERAAYLEEACAGDDALRRRVEALLRAHDQPGAFLSEAPPAPPGLATTGPAPEPPEPESRPIIAGRYQLLEEIGEGGMGTVWVAEQREPVRRLVAVKLVKAGMDSRAVLARFEAERQALALMDHPNIARVLDGGSTDAGRPYFVMELVKGLPLTEYCDGRRLSVRQRLELFEQICSAVQHAHQKGVIHRDLKPANVLVTEYDGKPVPKVIDFGLAKALYGPQVLTERTLHTAYGTVVGTPLYMAPEQVGINALDVDTRTDVYSLGVILYELLTGTTPLEQRRFKEAAWEEVKRLIREEEPPRPSLRLSSSDALPSLAANRAIEPARLTRLLRGELDWIVMKCLEKDRSRRYETANGLARDLERYLADEAVEAGPPSAAYRLRKLARRHRTALVTTAAFVVLLLAGVIVSGWQAVRATRAERETAVQRDVAVDNEQQAHASEAVARQKHAEALAAEEELRRTLYAAEINLAAAAWEADNVPRVRELLRAQVPPPGQRDLRGFEYYYWDRLSHGEAEVLALPGPLPNAGIYLPAFSGDGTRLAAVVARGTEFEVQVWDTVTGRKLLSAPLPGGPLPGGLSRQYLSAFSADGGRVAVVGRGDPQGARPPPWQVRLWDVSTGNELPALAVADAGPYVLIALNAAGTRLVTASLAVDPGRLMPAVRAEVKVWDIATRKTLLTAAVPSVRPGMALSPDGSRAAAMVAIDPKGNLQSPHGVKVWDVSTGKELFLLKPSGGEPMTQVLFSADGKQLAATGYLAGAAGAWFWDAATGKELRSLAGRYVGSHLVFSPDGRSVASYERSSPTVAVWQVGAGQPRTLFKGHVGGVVAVAFRADGKQLCVASPDGTLRTWGVPVEDRPKSTGPLPLRFAYTVLSPDGTRVANAEKFGSDTGGLQILDTSGRRLRSIPLPSRTVSPALDGLALSRGGARLAAHWMVPSPDNRCEIKVWDTATGREILSLTSNGSRSLALSADGSRLAMPFALRPEQDKQFSRVDGLKIWDVGLAKELRTLELLPRVHAHIVAFAPDGKRLATSPWEYSDPPPAPIARTAVRVWDVETGRELAPLKCSNAVLRTLAFSADGRLLAGGGLSEGPASGAALIDVWDTTTGQKRCTLKGHTGQITCLTFSPDGTRLVSAGTTASGISGEIRIWDAVTGNELTVLTDRGLMTDLAFRPDGHQLIGARSASADWQKPVQVWDGTPRPDR